MSDQTDQKDEKDPVKQDSEASPPAKDPVRKWTFIILALCIVLTGLYLVADRQTPFTTQAKVHAFVVPIAPQVSGNVISVEVQNNDQVTAGQVLMRIDPTDYELAVANAEAALQVTQQSIDAGVAEAIMLHRALPRAQAYRRVEELFELVARLGAARTICWETRCITSLLPMISLWTPSFSRS